jgi:four helix bundle protein
MEGESKKITTFTDLVAWQEAHTLVVEIYGTTKSFPREEIFGLTSQIRRCAVSITSNIAEGFSRQSYREKIQFYSTAQGSLTELQSQLYVARDVGFVSREAFTHIEQRAVAVHKLLNGLIKRSKATLNS